MSVLKKRPGGALLNTRLTLAVFLGVLPALAQPEPPAAEPPKPAPVGPDAPETPPENTPAAADPPAAEPAVPAPADQPPAPAPPGPGVAKDPEVAAAAGEVPGAEAEAAAEGTDAELTEADVLAELQGVEMDLLADDVVGEKFGLKFYGFADFQLFHFLMDRDNPWFILFDNASSFAVGNINLYMDGQISRRWRSLVEVRFTYLPHGDFRFDQGQFRANSTLSRDPADLGNRFTPGGIEIERAWLEYTAHSLLSIRGGQWLTPYGIWNVDHGSPTIIALRRPFVIGQQLFPERQTGFQVYGSAEAGDDSTIGYHATVSNGRGPTADFRDLDKNKAVGGRFWFRNRAVGNLTVGTSAYYGRFTDKALDLNIGSGPPSVTDDIGEQYDELALAADAKWQIEDFTIQAEAVVNQRVHTNAGRPVVDDSFLRPDHINWGTYGLLSYRTPWWDITPFMNTEYYFFRGEDPGIGSYDARVLVFTGGINVRPVPAIALKAAYSHAVFPQPEPNTTFDSKFNFVAFQAAWAF